MSNIVDKVSGEKIKGVRAVLLLVSKVVSNYINLMLNRSELMNQLRVKNLKELSIFSMNQYEIYQFNNDCRSAASGIRESAKKDLTCSRSLAIGG